MGACDGWTWLRGGGKKRGSDAYQPNAQDRTPRAVLPLRGGHLGRHLLDLVDVAGHVERTLEDVQAAMWRCG